MRKLLLFLSVLLTINFTYGQNLSEGFEGTTFPPSGWTVINLGDVNTWVRTTSYYHTGLASAYIVYNSSTAHNDYLITPQLQPSAGNFTLTFWAENYSSSYLEQFNVKLSTTGTAASDFTVTLASGVTPPTTWTQYSYNLSAYIGQNVYIAVQSISLDMFYLIVDDFAGPPLTPTSTPTAQPTALILTPGVSSVNGSFTAAAPAPSGGYLVVRSTSSSLSASPVNGTNYIAGDPLGGGVVVSSANSTTFLASGLNASTQYYFYIFSYNSGGTGTAYRTTTPLTGNTTTLAPTPLCGIKTVGATGCDYVNLTAAMTALGNASLCGPLTLQLNANYSSAGETFPIIVPAALGSSTTNTVTIKPNTGVTASITGAMAAGPIIRILNNNTIIDGSNAAGGTTRDLTISNTSVTTPQVIYFASSGTTPLTNVTLKNSNIINGVNSSSALIVGDIGGAVGGYFNNITIQNNTVQKAYIAIYCWAAVAAGNGSGLLITGNALNTAGANSIRLVAVYLQGVDGGTISNNLIGNIVNTTDAANVTGIWLATATINTTISGNTISGMSGSTGAPRGMAISSGVPSANLTVTGNTITNISTISTGSVSGIFFFSTTSGITISKNSIYNIKNTNAGGYAALGMDLASTATVSANCTVTNNAIWDITGYGYSSYVWNGMGLRVYSGFGYNIYFNTVYMNTEQTSTTGMPSALFIYSSVSAAGAIDLRNNIFSSSQLLGTNRYAVYCMSANTVFSNMDYNDYYTTGPNLGYIGSTRATLADIQAGFGGNMNSLSLNPTFVGVDLHPTNAALQRKGLYMASVTTDLGGAFRPNPPDVGVYQFSPNQAVTTVGSANITTTTATINGSITASNLSVTSGFQYGLTLAYELGTVAALPASVSGNTATPITADLTGLVVNNTYNYRAIGTSGSSVINGANMTFSTAVPPVITTELATVIGPTFATMNGTVNPKNATTTVSFEYGLSATPPFSSFATVPGTLTGNTVQNFSATLSGLVINNTYYFRSKAVSAAGTVYGTIRSFYTDCVIPAAPVQPSGPVNVCKTGSGYVYSVTPVAYAYVYHWSFPVGFTITSYPLSNSVTVSVDNTAVSGQVKVNAESACSAIGPYSPVLNVVVNNLPTPTVGPNSPVCQGANNTYTTQAGMSSYVWTATPDGTITPTANPQVVTINWPTTGAKTVGVVYTNPATGCTASAPGTVPVTVLAAPSPTVAGVNSLCINSGSYYYTTETGKSNYTWSIPTGGGTILGGQNTYQIEVLWNTPGAQTVAVNYSNTNNCFAGTPTAYNVTVAGMPDAAGSISGPSGVCFGSTGIPYSVAPIANAATYVWVLPAGASIASGAGMSSITVNFAANAVSGDITVYGNSLCGNGAVSPALTVTVTQLPAPALAVVGSDAVCEGSLGVPYSVPAIPGATGYKWELPVGASIASGDNTENITVDFAMGSLSGGVTVYGTNYCGNGATSPVFNVVVLPKPADPVITLTDDILSSSYADGNQWFYNGAPITNATGQTQLAQYSGWYWTVVTVNGCSSDTSNNIYVTVTGIEDPQAAGVVLSPVPNNGFFKATINYPGEESFTILVYNQLGEKVYESKDNRVKGLFEKNIDLRPAPSGIYSVIFQSVDKRILKKIIVNK